MQIKFSKMHGLGNDFIVINNLKHEYNLTPQQINLLADRKFGIGCDQVLIVEPGTDNISDFYYRIYNSDGSVAAQCGNGARCFTRYVIEHQLTNKTTVILQTSNRNIQGVALANHNYSIDMGIPSFTPSSIPLKHTIAVKYIINIDNIATTFYALSMGNPHAVILLDNYSQLQDSMALQKIAETLQKSELFPDSVNVNFVLVNTLDNITLRTFERGCGFTLACGSGACASAAMTILLGKTKPITNVTMHGGNLTIQWDKQNSLYMIGSATHVFDGQIILED